MTKPAPRTRRSLGGGARGRGGGIIGIEGQKGETMGATRRKWYFFYASCEPARTSLQRKKPKVKIARCSGMSKFCPPATASPESRQGNTCERTRSRADGGWGGGSNRQNWQVSASHQTSLAETAFSFWSFVFESAGSSLKKKKRRQTARPRI